MAGCCENLSAIYLQVVNILTLIFGVVILGISGYLLATLDEDFNAIDLGNPIIAALVIGIGLVIFSICGLVGTANDNKCLLVIYVIGVLCMGVAVLAAGAVLLTFGGKFQGVQDGQVQNAGEEKILTFELAIFNQCCGSQPGVLDAQECNGVIDVNPCFEDQELFDKFAALIDDDTCKLLEELELDGVPLVGDVLELDGRCGFGIISVFVNNVNTYVQDNLRVLGAICLVAGILLLLLLIAACVILWQREEERKQQQNKNKVGCF